MPLLPKPNPASAQKAESLPVIMPNQKPLSRIFLTFALLTLLCAGIFAPRVEEVEARPMAACPGGVITEWTFNNTTTPIIGSGLFASGTGINQIVPYPAGNPDLAAGFSGWATPMPPLIDPNEYVEFSIDTTAHSEIGISFDYRSTGTGPVNLDLQYSTDGTTFISFIIISLNNNAAFHSLSYDLSSIVGINNNPNTKIRLYGYGATGAGNLRLDNVMISEICPTPTPTETFTPSLTPVFSLTSSLTPVPGEVFISEVAWAGTQASSNDEWIELYNSRSTPIDITGWRLVTDSGSVDVILPFPSSIPANGTFLLERAHEQTVSPLSSLIYFGNLADTGEVLRLRKPNGTTMDTANSDGGTWPAGGGVNVASMERMGFGSPDTTLSWVTFNDTTFTAVDANNNNVYGTPGAANWGFNVTQTFTPTTTATRTRTPTATRTITPTPAGSMSVLINEVAWGGTLASSSDEWIELYNTTAAPINLAGWKLNASDGSPSINLSGTIQSHKYFIIATNNSVFHPSDNIVINQIFSGSLSNEGEVLRLLDGSNKIVDTANSDSGAWPAGIGYPTYASMERRGKITDNFFAWATFASTKVYAHDRNKNAIKGTPGESNWAITVTITPTRTATATRTRTPTRTPTRLSTTEVVGRPVINEFLSHPGFDWNQDGKVDVFDEFIEIKNLGPVDINLSGWQLDDEENKGSNPFTLSEVTLKPGERIAFYGLQTNILLSDGGDTVRLLNPSGKVYDSYTYKIAKVEDKSVCRLFPDGNGSWYEDCIPTPNLINSRDGKVPVMPDAGFESQVCDLPDTLPEAFLIAECRGYGANLWRAMFWDFAGWGGDLFVPSNRSKWNSFVE